MNAGGSTPRDSTSFMSQKVISQRTIKPRLTRKLFQMYSRNITKQPIHRSRDNPGSPRYIASTHPKRAGNPCMRLAEHSKHTSEDERKNQGCLECNIRHARPDFPKPKTTAATAAHAMCSSSTCMCNCKSNSSRFSK